jgi:sulfur-oxidizing protein SoxZ
MWLMRSDVGDARIRLPDRIAKGEQILVSAIISHPMDTGFFRTKDGDPIPAYFINEVTIDYGGQQVARFEWTSGISRDPLVTFSLRADREAPLTLTWKDNKGGVYRRTANVAFTTS